MIKLTTALASFFCTAVWANNAFAFHNHWGGGARQLLKSTDLAPLWQSLCSSASERSCTGDFGGKLPNTRKGRVD